MAARQPLVPVSSVPWLATGGALAALCIAWIAQYGFGLAPCELCYWQRYGYWAAIAIGVVAILQPARHARRTMALWLLTLAFLVTAGIAVFHVGVEQKWWEGARDLHRRISTGHDARRIWRKRSTTRRSCAATSRPGPCSASPWRAIMILYALALAAFTLRGALRSRAA